MWGIVYSVSRLCGITELFHEKCASIVETGWQTRKSPPLVHNPAALDVPAEIFKNGWTHYLAVNG